MYLAQRVYFSTVNWIENNVLIVLCLLTRAWCQHREFSRTRKPGVGEPAPLAALLLARAAAVVVVVRGAHSGYIIDGLETSLNLNKFNVSLIRARDRKMATKSGQ